MYSYLTRRLLLTIFILFSLSIVLFVSMVLVLWLGLGPSGVVPGIESVLEWTNESLTRLVTLK